MRIFMFITLLLGKRLLYPYSIYIINRYLNIFFYVFELHLFKFELFVIIFLNFVFLSFFKFSFWNSKIIFKTIFIFLKNYLFIYLLEI